MNASQVSQSPRHHYLRVTLAFLLSSFLLTLVLGFLGTYAVYDSTLSSVVHANNRAISFQEWRELGNGVLGGWRLFPEAKSICAFQQGERVLGTEAMCQALPSALDQWTRRVVVADVRSLRVILTPAIPVGSIALGVSLLAFLPVAGFFFLTRFLLTRSIKDLSLEALTLRGGQFDGFQKEIQDKAQKIIELEKDVATQGAIARTTQSLAHDVRKPFSMFKSIIQIVEATEDPEEVREVLKGTLPEVNQAMASVEGMIQDVMQIGSDSTLIQEDVAPEALLEAFLGDLFRVYPDAEVSLTYDLSHRHKVFVDSVRVGRVFSNILGNAVQAMREKGSLSIRTCERDGFVEFRIANEGSFIPAESLPKLFDAFFTSGKKGGTGLGLAIAKKIVEAHGGTIRCESERSEKYPSGKVVFVFTLPASEALVGSRARALPRSSQEIQAAFTALRLTSSAKKEADPREAEVERAIVKRLEKHSSMATVLVVDDESVYRNGVRSLLERSELLAGKVNILLAKDAMEAFAAVQAQQPWLVIQDVDLGPQSAGGLEVVKSLRDAGFSGQICVHSNRFLPEDNKQALEAGADTVLPKPMGRAHFLKLILASIPTAQALAPDVPAQAGPLNVALVDDSLTMRMGWRTTIGMHTAYLGFRGSQEFWAACAKDAGYLDRLDVIVTDYNFAPDDPEDGGTFARALRERGYRGLIFRASGEGDLGAEIEALFDADVGKSPLKGDDFLALVATARQARDRV